MKHSRFGIFSGIAIPFLALGLALVPGAMAGTVGFSIDRSTAQTGQVDVRVVDERTQKPIEDATVSLTEKLDSRIWPWKRSSTDATGKTGFRILKASAVTVSKAGYTTASIVGVESGSVTVFLKPSAQNAKEVIASGTLGGWDPPSSTNAALGGLVFRSLGVLDLLDFQVNGFISPLKDTIQLFGSREIPSNVVLPDQDIFLPIGSIRLNKPDYRLPVEADLPFRLTGVQAEVRVSDIMPHFQSGKKMTVDILNKVKITRVGLSSTLSASEDFREDFDAILSVSPRHQVTISQPPFAADVISVAATDLRGDRQLMIPTDVKAPMALDNPSKITTVSLSAPRQNMGSSQDVFTFAVAERGRRMTGIVTQSAGKIVKPGAFLAVDSLPSYSRLPATVVARAGARGFAMVTFLAAKGSDSRGLFPAWNVYVLPAAGQSLIPTEQLPSSLSVRKYAITQLEFEDDFNPGQIDGALVMKKLRRFTRASAAQTRN